jgi:subfamily B ATP-binding cassette protein MsbA
VVRFLWRLRSADLRLTGEAITMSVIGQRIICDLQNRLFSHLMKLDLNFYHRNSSGELISRFTNDIMLMRYSVSNVIVGLGKDLTSLVVLIAIMFYRDWMLASIAFFLLPSVILPISKISRRMRKVTYNTQDEFGKITSQLSQIFQGMRVVKTYGMESYEVSRVESATERVYELITKASRIRATTSPIIEVLGGLTTTMIIAYGGWQVLKGARTAGEFISFTGALLLCYDPLKRLGN